MKNLFPVITSLLTLPFLALHATAAPRDVQIRTIDFTTGVIEFHNFGTADESLAGWRFCTHDGDQVRRYSGSGGFSGQTIEAGTSYYIHFNNDAPAGDSDRIDRSTLGGSFATPLSSAAYGMQIYFAPVSFGNGNSIADHLQWSIDGTDNTSADDRTDEAFDGGVWTVETAWISTTVDTEQIVLDDTTGAVLHSPANYSVVEPMLFDPETFELLSIEADDVTGVTLEWTEVPDGSFEVFTSTDLVTWSSLGTTTDLTFTATGDLDPSSFYRVEVTF